MKLNPDLVRARCSEIEESVSRLERFRGLSREQFLADQDTLDIACYRLLVAIEAALALCYHVSAKRLRKVPEEYAECFGMLRDAGILPAELAGRLQQMARFRNLLVRMYWKIDYGQVFDVLQHKLGDLRGLRRRCCGWSDPDPTTLVCLSPRHCTRTRTHGARLERDTSNLEY